MRFNTPNPNVLARSRLLSTLFQRNVVFGEHKLHDWISQSIVALCNPLALQPVVAPTDFAADEEVRKTVLSIMNQCQQVRFFRWGVYLGGGFFFGFFFNVCFC